LRCRCCRCLHRCRHCLHCCCHGFSEDVGELSFIFFSVQLIIRLLKIGV
jgi:hypothetical protein